MTTVNSDHDVYLIRPNKAQSLSITFVRLVVFPNGDTQVFSTNNTKEIMLFIYMFILKVLTVTKVVSSNSGHGRVYSMQHYVIKSC